VLEAETRTGLPPLPTTADELIRIVSSDVSRHFFDLRGQESALPNLFTFDDLNARFQKLADNALKDDGLIKGRSDKRAVQFAGRNFNGMQSLLTVNGIAIAWRVSAIDKGVAVETPGAFLPEEYVELIGVNPFFGSNRNFSIGAYKYINAGTGEQIVIYSSNYGDFRFAYCGGSRMARGEQLQLKDILGI